MRIGFKNIKTISPYVFLMMYTFLTVLFFVKKKFEAGGTQPLMIFSVCSKTFIIIEDTTISSVESAFLPGVSSRICTVNMVKIF